MILFENSRMIYIKRLTGAMVKTTISIFKKEIKGPKISKENNMLKSIDHCQNWQFYWLIDNFFNYLAQNPRVPQ